MTNEHLEGLIRDWRDDALDMTVFIGAGIGQSPPSRLPSWGDLVHEMFKAAISKGKLPGARDKEPIRSLYKDGRYPEALEALYNCLGPAEYSRFVVERLSWSGDPPRLISILSRARTRRIITTNVDKLLDRNMDREVSTPSSPSIGDALQRKGEYLVKLHGHLEDSTSWVFRKSEYEAAYGGKGPLRKVLETVFASGPVVFVGYSMQDPEISKILKDLSSVLRGNRFGHYVLLPGGTPFPEEKWAQFGVRPVFYDVLPNQDRHLGLEKLLEKLLPSYSQVPDVVRGREAPEVLQKRHALNTTLSKLYDLKERLESNGAPTDDVRDAIKNHRSELYALSYVDIASNVFGNVILKKLGSGSFGSVWLADSESGGGPVALKVFHPNHAAEDEKRARFVRGIRAMQRLAHPGIVRAYDQYEAPLAFTMEYVDGTDLERAIVARPEKGGLVFRDGQEFLVLKNVVEAVQYAHDNDVYHRDLKPANVLIKNGIVPTPAITDFDIAYYEGATTLTFDGAGVGGTLAYGAPEQWESKTGDVRTPTVDVYSVGMLVYFSVCRKDPLVFDAIAGKCAERVEAEARAKWGSQKVALLLRRLVSQSTNQVPRSRLQLADVHAELSEVHELLKHAGYGQDWSGFAEEVQLRIPHPPSIKVVVRPVRERGDRMLDISINGERVMLGFKSSFAKAIGGVMSNAKAWCFSRKIEITTSQHTPDGFVFSIRLPVDGASFREAGALAERIVDLVHLFQP